MRSCRALLRAYSGSRRGWGSFAVQIAAAIGAKVTGTRRFDRTFRPAEAPQAVRYLQHGQTRGGKVVITVSDR
jgi:hypothetical protein